MTPDQANDGFVELSLPDGGRVLVSFGGEVSSNPDLEAAVVTMMLAATGGEEVRDALADYAEASGLTAVISRDGSIITMAIADTGVPAGG
jgi:hypothetical protein